MEMRMMKRKKRRTRKRRNSGKGKVDEQVSERRMSLGMLLLLAIRTKGARAGVHWPVARWLVQDTTDPLAFPSYHKGAIWCIGVWNGKV